MLSTDCGWGLEDASPLPGGRKAASSDLRGVPPSSPGSGGPESTTRPPLSSAVRDAEQLAHERGGKGVDVLDAQEPLCVLGADAAKLSECGHNLQEQEPAGQPEDRMEASPALPPPSNPGTAPQLHRFGGFDLRTSLGRRKTQGSEEFCSCSFSCKGRAESLGDLRCGPALAIQPSCSGLESCTQRLPGNTNA